MASQGNGSILEGLIGAIVGALTLIALHFIKERRDRERDKLFAANLLSYIAISLREALGRPPQQLRHISLDVLIPHFRVIVADERLRRNLLALQDWVLRWQAGGLTESSAVSERAKCRSALDAITEDLNRISEAR